MTTCIQPSDRPGIELATKSALTTEQETPEMAAFLDALDEYGLFMAEDAIACGSGYPSGVPRDPDVYGAERRFAVVVEAARKAFAPPAPAPTPAKENESVRHGLDRVWDWSKRGAL